MGSALTVIIRLATSDYYLRHVCLFLHMEQLGSHWKDFNEL